METGSRTEVLQGKQRCQGERVPRKTRGMEKGATLLAPRCPTFQADSPAALPRVVAVDQQTLRIWTQALFRRHLQHLFGFTLFGRLIPHLLSRAQGAHLGPEYWSPAWGGCSTSCPLCSTAAAPRG